MNANRVDLGPVLREGVDASFKAAPVILVAPVGNERLGRVDASRRLRSLSAACGTCTLKGVTSLVAAGSAIREAFFALSCALIGIGRADNKPAPAVMAVCMNRRRFSELCMMYSSLMKLCCLNSREHELAKLEHQ
jgi:hypothetical protein